MTTQPTLDRPGPTPPQSQSQSQSQSTVDRAAGWLTRNSVDVLRISLGVVFVVFGALKFFPGISPAEDIATRTVEVLTLGILGHGEALLFTAMLETFVGLTLVTARLLRTGLVVLAGAVVGFFAPLVLFTGEMFPGGVPTLEAQYILKDIVLAAAGLVVAAKALGARMVPPTK